MKLFRRLSGKAPRPQSLASYSKYALGEIVLVVAGILIAVSLNNWNERRQDAAMVDELLTMVETELRQDLDQVADAFSFYDRRAPVFERVLAGSLTREDYLENRGFAFLLIGYPEVSLHRRGIDLLKGFEGAIPSNRTELIGRLIAAATEWQLEISVDDQLRADDFMANFTHFKETMPWWADYIHHKEIEGFIPYALEDPDYRNRVATSHFIAYEVFLPELRTFQGKAETLLEEIKAAKSGD